jgi:hypothetical protein
VQPVADVVAAELAKWNVSAVEAAVFGTEDPDGIAAIVSSFCELALGARPAGGLFYRGSSGCALGLRLDSGDDVVLKAYQERWTAPFLVAVQVVQGIAAAGGIPCPAPLKPPRPLPGRGNFVLVETHLPDPGMRAPRSEAARRVSAAGLARQIGICAVAGEAQAKELALHPLRGVEGRLYPEPHSPLFDFEGTARGAEWIDALAAEAKMTREPEEFSRLIAHTDWSARNVRLDDERLLAVYDWDSLALVAETTAVGQAAVTWPVTSEPGGSTFPSLADIVAYVEDYEAAARTRLSPAEWRAVGAAAAWVLAYTARCEHALESRGEARSDQRGARDRLTDAGTALMTLTGP